MTRVLRPGHHTCCCRNVASYCAMMLLRKGAKVLALSDSKGYVYVEDGLTEDQLKQVGVPLPGADCALQLVGQQPAA